ncbi:hypothetical protein BKA70DRAFT_1279055 [Coprinopsis sp. MPI-PUGE-AT-0042]|nr:hypothetical protein BKA70DRAFT_1279055 [Coprinopsis sp. MPI-PUGE-AT-0042]
MSTTMKMDERILPYTRNNDPLPSKLRPILDAHLEAARIHIAACDARIVKMQEKILERQDKIEALEKEIVDVQAEVEEETMMKNDHFDTIRTLASTISVVRRLPPEVIASFMAITAPHTNLGHTKNDVATFSSVSRLWRATAISTPGLWRSLSVDLNHDRFLNRSDEETGRIFTNTMNLWFSRGGKGLGIDLNLYGRCVTLKSQAILDWIQTSNFNFADLTLPTSFNNIIDIQNLLSKGAPSLKSTKTLTLNLPSSALVPPTPTRVNAEATLPNLSYLRLIGFHQPLSFLMDHPGLTKLNISQAILRTGDIYRILNSLPSLQSLMVMYCPVEEDEDIEMEDQTHHSLQHISLTDMLWGHTFNGLTCPSLERLELSSDSLSEDFWAEAFGNFIRRSSSSGITLYLWEQFPSSFLNILLSTSSPNIRTLSLRTADNLPLNGDI